MPVLSGLRAGCQGGKALSWIGIKEHEKYVPGMVTEMRTWTGEEINEGTWHMDSIYSLRAN